MRSSFARTAAAAAVLSVTLVGCTSAATTNASPGPTLSGSTEVTTPVGGTSSPVPSPSPSSPSPSPSPSPLPSVVRKVTPPRVTKDEISRVVFPGRGGSVEETVEAPVTKNSYVMTAACTSRTPGRTLTFSLQNAASKGALDTAERVLASSGIECNGRPHMSGYEGVLPHTVITISVGQTNGITSLYAVLRPSM